MAKKNSSKKHSIVVEKPVIQKQEKPSYIPKKPSSEMDEIFACRKRKKPVKAKNPTEDVADKPKKVKKKKKECKVNDDNVTVALPSRPRKRTGYGLAIYTEEELGIGIPDAGGTFLCPFDCDSCF